MRLLIGLFLLAVLTIAVNAIGFALWDTGIGHRDATMRTIHYDTNYDISAQRRIKPQ